MAKFEEPIGNEEIDRQIEADKKGWVTNAINKMLDSYNYNFKKEGGSQGVPEEVEDGKVKIKVKVRPELPGDPEKLYNENKEVIDDIAALLSEVSEKAAILSEKKTLTTYSSMKDQLYFGGSEKILAVWMGKKSADQNTKKDLEDYRQTLQELTGDLDKEILYWKKLTEKK